MDEKRTSLPALTGLRFLAALWVVFGHFAASWRIGSLPNTQVGEALYYLADNNIMAVSLFFVLSGFILTYRAAQYPRTPKVFYLARVKRLYPTYLIALVVAFAPFLWDTADWSIHDRIAASLATLTLTQAWFPTLALAWDGPAWSLSCEMFFYLLFPWVLRPLRRLRTYQLLLVAIGCYGAALAIPRIVLGDTPKPEVNLGLFVILAPIMRLPDFILGMAAGRLFLLHRRGTSNKLLGIISDLALSAVPVAVLCTHSIWFFFRHNGLLTPLFAVSIVALAQYPGILARLLTTRTFLALGEGSYALFLIHYPLWEILDHVGLAPPVTSPECFPFFSAYLGLAVALSLLTHQLLSRSPIRNRRSAPPSIAKP